jgi:glucokinase
VRPGTPRLPRGHSLRHRHRQRCALGAIAWGAVNANAHRAGGHRRARSLLNRARAGDELAIRLYGVAGRALGRAIGGLVNLLAPEVIVVGGGLINAGELLFAPLRTAVPEIAFEVPLQRCRIVTAALGTDAGLVGAVAWAVRVFGD